MEIRAEKPEEIEAIHKVNVAAFGRESEADLVDRLRGLTSTLSFVAVKSGQVIGHIFFSPVEIEGECADANPIIGLAPLAVLPNYQRQGVGALMIQHGLGECARFGFKAVVVLGHPEYYSRFGFTSAIQKGLRCEFKVPEEAFMVLELESKALERCVGTIKYRSEFNEFE